MPKRIRFWLLNAQEEWFETPGAIIETRANALKREAMGLHDAWLQDGGSLSKKRAFAFALREWGKETQNRDAVQHAQSLLQEGA